MLPYVPNIGISETYGTITRASLSVHPTLHWETSIAKAKTKKLTTSSKQILFAPKLEEPLERDKSQEAKDRMQKKLEREQSKIDEMEKRRTLSSFESSGLYDPTLSTLMPYIRDDNNDADGNSGNDDDEGEEEEEDGDEDVVTHDKSDTDDSSGDSSSEGEQQGKNNESENTKKPKLKKTFRLKKTDFFDPNISTQVQFFYLRKKLHVLFVLEDKVLTFGTMSKKFRFCKSIKLKSSIKCIQMVQINDGLALSLVRTNDDVYLLKCLYREKSLIVTKVFSFTRDDTWAGLADVKIHVGDTLKLCIIDNIGKFQIWETTGIGKTDFKKLNNRWDSIYQPQELSNFKRIVWVNENRLFFYSRSQVFNYELQTDELILKVNGGTWTRFLDLVKCNNELYFFLTTKEFIVVDVRDGSFMKLLSWKHYWNDQDTSMFMNVLNGEDTKLCVVTSKHTGINFVVEFNPKTFQFVNQPYHFFTTNQDPAISITFNFEASQLVALQKTAGNVVSFLKVEYGNGNENVRIDDSNNTRFAKFKFPFFQENHYKILDGEPVQSKNEKPAEITARIYDNLETFLDTQSTAQISLIQLIEELRIPRNTKNVIKIVQHMIKNDNHNDTLIKINKSCYKKGFNVTGEYANEDTLNNQLDQITDFINSNISDENSSEVIFYLFLSSIEIWKTKQSMKMEETKREYASYFNDLPHEYREMIDSFEEDFYAVGINESEDESTYSNPRSSNIFSVPSVSISQVVPTVSVSQPKQKIVPKKKSKIAPKGSIFSSPIRNSTQPSQPLESSQPSQQSQLLTQKFSQPQFGISQSKGPKKKRRRTGF